MNSGLLQELELRGLISQISHPQSFASWVESGSRTLYCGFDPTAGSLHIGHLLPVLMLRRFQLHGHRPLLLVGGATGLIGDPSFKDTERSLVARELVEEWKAALARQLATFVDFDSGRNSALLADNLTWTEPLDVISFLRDVGKHFSVNTMLQKESVRARLEREGEGLSFTEFSYMLLQAFDFLELARRHECSLQIGGNDQWGNITLGVELIRRELGRQAFALTLPLLTRSDGRKFGKTEAGSVWLDARLTSPYSLYQYWLNVTDADVPGYLRAFTFLDATVLAELARETAQHPERRQAQRQLAEEVTRLVHGDAALASAERITRALFHGSLAELEEADCAQLALDGVPSAEIAHQGTTLADAMVLTGLAKSKGDARRQAAAGGVSLNGVQGNRDASLELAPADALFGRFHLIRRGKKSWGMVSYRAHD